jgi:hypothetical protein
MEEMISVVVITAILAARKNTLTQNLNGRR